MNLVYSRSVLSRCVAALLLVSLAFLSNLFQVHVAEAAALTALSNTMSSQTASATSSHVIRFTTPSGANASTDTIIITFPSGFDFTGKTISGLTLTHGVSTGAETTEPLIASANASNWGAAFSGASSTILTLTPPTDGSGVSTLAPGEKVVISYTAASSTNPSTPNSYSVSIGGAFGDTGSITVNILSSDQVSIDATVAQSLTFSISDSTIGFGTLSAAGPRFATGDLLGSGSETEAHNFIVGTNAANGYTVTATGTTLTSGVNTINAIGAANTVSAIGTEQFGLRINASGGSGAVVAPYAAAGFAFDSAAFPDQVATSTGSSANTTYSVRYLANITSNTEAGSYSAIINYIATANY